jgi:hypothetical protein
MPRPIAVPIRQTMFRLWQQGYGTRQIVASLSLPCSTVQLSPDRVISLNVSHRR